jgi:DNA-directed RNA polymerase subunit alpha
MKKQIQKNWRELIKPNAVEIDRATFSDFYGKFTCQPLERGFGLTLGNALRRILLSSLQGASIVSVKFDGVPHEFSTISGVKEDTAEIILNIKEVNVSIPGEEEEVKVYLDISGEKIVKAGDMVTEDKVVIMNPGQYIATLNKDAELHAEMVVRTGKGYVPAEKSEEIGFIPIDALYSPIRKASYIVGNARVGQRTDYDKLTLEIWTNGAVNPQDALTYAAKILKEQTAPFINLDEELEQEIEEEEKKEEEKKEEKQINENLFKPVSELELSVRSSNCLKNANIKHIYTLVQKTEGEMLKTKNFGRKSLNEIKGILEEMGLHFGMELDDIPFDKHLEQSQENNKDIEQ